MVGSGYMWDDSLDFLTFDLGGHWPRRFNEVVLRAGVSAVQVVSPEGTVQMTRVTEAQTNILYLLPYIKLYIWRYHTGKVFKLEPIFT